MADTMTAEQRHVCMSHIKGKNTKPEIKIRKQLWLDGFRYRVNVQKLPYTPDIVLSKYKTVIFVNGCFWHGHDGCAKYVIPKTNQEFWRNKISATKERDNKAYQCLVGMGWYVIVVWECELTKNMFNDTITKIESQLRHNKAMIDINKQNRAQDRNNKRMRKQEALAIQKQFNISSLIIRESKHSEE